MVVAAAAAAATLGLVCVGLYENMVELGGWAKCW